MLIVKDYTEDTNQPEQLPRKYDSKIEHDIFVVPAQPFLLLYQQTHHILKRGVQRPLAVPQ